MLHKEIITVCSEIHTKHVNAVCVQNVQGLNVKLGGTYNKHWTSKREHEFQPPFAQCVFANGTHGCIVLVTGYSLQSGTTPATHT